MVEVRFKRPGEPGGSIIRHENERNLRREAAAAGVIEASKVDPSATIKIGDGNPWPLADWLAGKPAPVDAPQSEQKKSAGAADGKPV